MDELLASVLDAHGGLESWNRLPKLTARLSVGGPFWSDRGWPGVYANQTVTLDAHRQHISFARFAAPDRVSVLDVDPERVTIQTTHGEIVQDRTDPRSPYPLPFDRSTTPWDAIHVAYFPSAGVWNYLTEPAAFTYPGVEAREIEPWEEHGERWRRLAVTVPKPNANHNPDQVFYVDESFLQRRMDCSPNVTGNPPVAHHPPLRHTHFLPGGTAVAETLTCAIVAPGSPKQVTATPATSRGVVMLQYKSPVLDVAVHPDPDEFIRAAMEWHFSPATGSPYWLKRAESLGFDPRVDVRTCEDLTLFPNVTNELRDVRAEDLVPQGYGPHPDVVGVFESGGTTGAPKRIVMLRDWFDRMLAWYVAHLDARGVPRNRNWLVLFPSGPHMVGELMRGQAAALGGLSFTIDMDSRWVKRLIAAGKADEADAYAEHLIDQAAFVLQTQDVAGLASTPPLLERLARREDLVELVRQKVQLIEWNGAQMDADTRQLYRTEVFRGMTLVGGYGSTMVLGGASERLGLTDEDPCIFDPFSPYVTFSVVDPDTGNKVAYGERGQVVMNHVSRSFLLPNNLERDTATRIQPPEAQVGDSVADVTPVKRFDGETVIEGVY